MYQITDYGALHVYLFQWIKYIGLVSDIEIWE